ncbi:carboxypeptidase-like regulatory domain-containing protein [Mucilaginibacter sp. SG564]|uniref:carboxypeptidase-like regulatory domain-containing protein n=1 Tax=unclassified Mucilaginibacter TaxID=2617802 RepID=UPI00155816D6|nr:carboxypeptidase-like regulatory domain-containing protein [Mucilaginibacter sp. SG564]NOW98135.1 hypothetical protein [Mucilaginibacter sp. SG564]
MQKFLLLLILLSPSFCFAQLKISGKVINLNDKKPIPDASVFLNNASAGNKTSADGSFVLGNVRPGQYDLIVSVIGYETYNKTISVVNSNVIMPEIALLPKTIELKEVKIKPNPDWGKYYDIFKHQFLGTSANAAQCKILNPDQLDLEFDAKTRILQASSYDFLEIENKALGYKIKYKLNQFTYDPTKGFLYYDGISVFEDLAGSSSKMRKWKKKRQTAYLGSPMHFLRTIITNQLLQEGFEVFKLMRKPNPEYKGGPFDSKNKYLQTLIKQPLDVNAFAKRTDQPGLFALSFNDCLYIMYNKKANSNPDRTPDASDVATSIATLDEHEAYAFFDNNGIIHNPRSIVFEGDWTSYRFAEMLPVDYEPIPRK